MAIALSWPLSSDALVRLGNGAGQWQSRFLAGLLAAGMVSWMAAAVIRRPLPTDGGFDSGRLLTSGLGPLPAMTLIIASRVSLVLLLPTGLLVSAGYTFNEVFVYWFPNFGFSYLLLFSILLAHLAGERAALMLQPIFAGLVIICLLLLMVLGFGRAFAGQGETVQVQQSVLSALPSSSAMALVLFLGYDAPASPASGGCRPFGAAILVMLLISAGWSLVSLAFLSAELLAESTISHIQVARAIAGEPGRVLMGIAVIAGTCVAVNGLFLMARHSLAGLAAQNLLPGHRQGAFPAGIHPLLFSLLIGVMLASGLGGADILETYIEAALLLWLIIVAVQCLAAFRLLRSRDALRAAPAAVAGLLLAGAAVVILSSHGEAQDIARFLIILLLSVTLVSALWLRLHRGAGGTPN
jgi:hypothetical protein